MKNKEKTEQLRKIKEEIVELKESPLRKERIKNGVLPVIGEGNHDAKIMFIGEAPGKNEAEQGRPFCGAAGKVLDELLEHVKLDRGDVYITNIVKDRPPGNRDPHPEEIRVYSPFLDRQINIIQPDVLVTLGRFSTKYIMEKFGAEGGGFSMGELHGKSFDVKAEYGDIKIIPMFHPAAALYDRTKKEVMEKDFEKMKNIINK